MKRFKRNCKPFLIGTLLVNLLGTNRPDKLRNLIELVNKIDSLKGNLKYKFLLNLHTGDCTDLYLSSA